MKQSGFELWLPDHFVVFLSKRHFILTVPLSPLLYKWVPANEILGELCNGLASHPGTELLNATETGYNLR